MLGKRGVVMLYLNTVLLMELGVSRKQDWEGKLERKGDKGDTFLHETHTHTHTHINYSVTT